MTTRRALLEHISDRVLHSGESLAQALSMSRAAVWKQIQALQADGLQIDSLSGQGYRLCTHISLLDRERVLDALPAALRKSLTLSVFDELPSTNAYLMQLRDDVCPHVCLAEKQVQGRGRRGRGWCSPLATSLAMSLKWRFEHDAGRLAGLSLAVGVAAATALQQLGVDGVQLKWPNDLHLRGAKLGGILIELSGDAAGPCTVVIGIGINVSNSTAGETAGMQTIDQQWTDLYTGLGESTPSRSALAAALIEQLLLLLPRFAEQGFAPWQSEFAQRDALLNREVQVQHPQHGSPALVGTAKGVDHDGALQLETTAGVQRITAGEVSVRALPKGVK